MRTEIIAVGTELLNGKVSDTNTHFLSGKIRELGHSLKLVTTVGDDETYLEAVIAASMTRSDIIIITGGLGATIDDLTKHSVSKVLNRKLVFNPEVMDAIKKRFERNQITMPASEQKQALIPRRCTLIPNKYGTAPGFICLENGTAIICLPGVPNEMEQMWSDEVAPFLKERYGMLEHRVTLMARTCNLREAEVDEILAGIASQDGIAMTLIARDGGVDALFSMKGEKNNSVEMRSAQLKIEVEKLLGPSLYAWGDLNMEEIVGKLLKEKKLTLAVAESCTGGLISHRLTQVPGSSAYFERGLVTYSNRAKQELLGVQPRTLEEYGAVSSQVAREMARGIRERASTDLGISITGIAGPEGGSAEKPMGMVYCALSSYKECLCQSFGFLGMRDIIKQKGALACLNMLRQYLEQKH